MAEIRDERALKGDELPIHDGKKRRKFKKSYDNKEKSSKQNSMGVVTYIFVTPVQHSKKHKKEWKRFDRWMRAAPLLFYRRDLCLSRHPVSHASPHHLTTAPTNNKGP